MCACDVSGYYDVLAAKNKRSAHNKSITAPHEGIFAVCVYIVNLSNSISCGSSVKILIRPHLFDDDCFPCSKCFPIIYLSKYARTIFSRKMNYTVEASRRTAYVSIIWRVGALIESNCSEHEHNFVWPLLAFLYPLVVDDVDDDAIIHLSVSIRRLRLYHITKITTSQHNTMAESHQDRQNNTETPVRRYEGA